MRTIQIVLASRPNGMPGLNNFRMEEVDLPVLRQDEVLMEGIYYSVDPYLRGRMNEKKSYIPCFEIGKPLTGAVVAKVIESRSRFFETGDIITGNFAWQKRTIETENNIRKVDTKIAPASFYLGVLGMTGLTAYFGLMHIGKPKAGETVVVSGAAGAVGMVVGQISAMQGCYVVGIAGTDEKIKTLKELGFDDAINYKKTPDLQKAISTACPNGVDVYFDNVGGEISDAVLSHINSHARIPLCGQISLYNSNELPTGPRLGPVLLTRSALMQGFMVSDFHSEFPDGMKQLAAWVKGDRLKSTETIEHGFEKLPRALLGLFQGDNTGKMIVEA